MWVFVLVMCSGCGSWRNKTVSESVRYVQTEKQDFKGDLKTEYPSPSKTDLNLSASGNARINVNVPVAETKMVKLSNQTAGKMSSNTSFSLDSLVRSVSLGGWVAVILAFCGMLYTIVYFINRTMCGKALDAGLAASVKVVQSVLYEVNEKLLNSTPGTSEWCQFNEIRNKRQYELQQLMREIS